MASFKSDRTYGSVDGDQNAKAIFSDRRQPAWTGWIQLVFALLPFGSAVAYGMTGHPGWLAFLIISTAWMVVGAVTNELYKHETWLQVIERRCQLIEQDADDLSKQVSQLAASVRSENQIYR